jgi:carbonic anhydrase/acetyltransferase-like protein (isoleucine patch superfamily)
MAIYQLNDRKPVIPASCYIAEEAIIIGDVVLGERVNIWFGAVLRGDNEPIVIGEGSNVQENCVLHTDPGAPLTVGRNVTVGHQVMLHGCTIGDEVLVGHNAMLEGCVICEHALIGMGAIVLQRARVGARAMVAAGAVVGEGAEIGPGMLAAGVPAREKKELSGSALRWTDTAVGQYQQLRDLYLNTMEESRA